MQTVSNPRKSAHTVFTKDGPVRIKPGETAEVNITAAEAKELEPAGLVIGKRAAKEVKSDDAE